jgi:hypothetical protein
MALFFKKMQRDLCVSFQWKGGDFVTLLLGGTVHYRKGKANEHSKLSVGCLSPFVLALAYNASSSLMHLTKVLTYRGALSQRYSCCGASGSSKAWGESRKRALYTTFLRVFCLAANDQSKCKVSVDGGVHVMRSQESTLCQTYREKLHSMMRWCIISSSFHIEGISNGDTVRVVLAYPPV